MSDLLYYAESNDGRVFTHYKRERVLEWYKNNNAIKIFTKTKDLFPTINTIVDRPNIDINNIRDDDTINKTSVSLRKAVAKYDKKNTKQINLKFNLSTDKEILEKLENVGNIQGYIKKLIKEDLFLEKKYIVELSAFFQNLNAVKREEFGIDTCVAVHTCVGEDAHPSGSLAR